MTKNRTRTPVYLDPGMHPGLEVKGLRILAWSEIKKKQLAYGLFSKSFLDVLYVGLYAWFNTIKSDPSTAGAAPFQRQTRIIFCSQKHYQGESGACPHTGVYPHVSVY